MMVGETLAAGSTIEPGHPKLIELSQKLIGFRTGSDWGDTRSTASAVQGLSALLKRHDSKTDVRVTLLGDGKQLASVVASAASPASSLIAVSGKEIDGIKKYSLSVAGDPSNLFWSLKASALKNQPLELSENAKLSAPRVSQTVFRIRPERERLAVDDRNILTVRRGEPLEVHITIKLSEPMTAPALVWHRPCGVEVLRPHKDNGSTIVHFETTDTDAIFFAQEFAPGVRVIKFIVRAESSGDVFAPLPELKSMYDATNETIATGPTRWKITD